MVSQIEGPGLMLSQFIGETAPFNSLEGIARWAHGLGFRGLQVPVHDPGILDVAALAQSAAKARDTVARLAGIGMVISELAAHRAGHLMAVNPAFDQIADAFSPKAHHGNPAGRQADAERTMFLAIQAAKNLGVHKLVTFSGALVWPFFYPWPPPPAGLIERGFDELAARWRPVVEHAADHGVDLLFELHPGEDVHDGVTFAMFLERLQGHSAVKILFDPSHMLVQHMDYLGFIDHWAPRIGGFHVKDAEFIKSAQSGVYGGFAEWRDRPGRFRSPGDGQVDFKGIFSRLAHAGYAGWAVLEWECALKSPEQGAREGAAFIRDHIIQPSSRIFDAALRRPADRALLDSILGIKS